MAWDDKGRKLVARITAAGLAGAVETELLKKFCAYAVDLGIPLSRAHLVVDTLHPIYEGRIFRWSREEGLGPISEYGRTDDDPEILERWQKSPLYHLIETGQTSLRLDLSGDDPNGFSMIDELRDGGHTEYAALCHRFAAERAIGEMDCILSSWCTDAEGGFTAEQYDALESATASLALAIKSASLARIADTLVETYLGRDAGHRVLAGRISRGVADKIFAALWFSDLRGFTAISDSYPPEALIPLLNDYADAVVSSIHEAGGDVLKLIGDGTLAIFTHPDPAAACKAALVAEDLAQERVQNLNARRAAAGLPWTELYVGLHVGEVFYGNIGSAERLDFTVVGPAVNEASRIATMCRSAERNLLLSSAFQTAAREADRATLVSVGRYALRGVERPQELFTRDRSPKSLPRD
ncbi:adenylate cyclase [Arboricoccus pini]|uniref:Adenylate cyclase n=1 Tax=Arboricoccus pini TaxID=1963835 RepID=A0A212PXT7_9PROT|nr:adenylate/guanylate cyclase domain-containing protein [Arboricoccus pini]SNB51804.1 adenylate cyclase [Arboricoccus pini]